MEVGVDEQSGTKLQVLFRYHYPLVYQNYCRSIHVFPFLSIFMHPRNQGMFVTCVSTLQVLEFGIGTKILCDTDIRCNCLVFVPERNIICP